MLTEAAIVELMDEYEETPAAAEAAYLVARRWNLEAIINNIEERYGTGQGYAQFKRDLEEMTGCEITHDGSFLIHVNDDQKQLYNLTVDDVGVSLESRLRNAFLKEIEPTLREEMVGNLAELSEDAKLVAGIMRDGYDTGLWESDTTEQSIWHSYSLIHEQVLSDKQKATLRTELLNAGCAYIKRSNLTLTPMLVNLPNPHEHLPHLEVEYQELQA